MNNEITELILCECHSPEHQIILTYWPDDNEICATIHLASIPWYKRIVYAFKYIFGYKSKYGAFDEIIVDKQKFIDFEKKLEIV